MNTYSYNISGHWSVYAMNHDAHARTKTLKIYFKNSVTFLTFSAATNLFFSDDTSILTSFWF